MKAGMHVGAAVLAAAVGLGAGPAAAWELVGTKTVALVTREGLAVPIGTVDFRPEGGRVRFTVQLDESRFKDYFLSMWPFKCIDGGGETTCHVHYPYDMPATVTADDLAWLEHALLFFHNVPRDYAAKLDKGLYYKMKLTDDGIVGTPQAIDLALIEAPPADLNVPPYGPGERWDIEARKRWFVQLTIR